MDDTARVLEVQRTGDPDHFAALVAGHKGRVFRLVASILGPGHEGEAEEISQEVFLKVYQRIGQFRGDSKFSSWLYRIAYRQAIDHVSRASFKAHHLPEEVLRTTPTDRPEADPLARAIGGRRKRELGRCLAELPHLYRSVLHLHYWMGMTVREIGEVLSTPEGTIKSYMHRARAQLAKALSGKELHHV